MTVTPEEASELYERVGPVLDGSTRGLIMTVFTGILGSLIEDQDDFEHVAVGLMNLLRASYEASVESGISLMERATIQ